MIAGDLELNRICLYIATEFDISEAEIAAMKDEEIPDFSGNVQEAWRVVRALRPHTLTLSAYGYAAEAQFDDTEVFKGEPAMAICAAAATHYKMFPQRLRERLEGSFKITK